MILKIRKTDTEWKYYDKIKSISVDVPKEYILSQFKDFGGCRYLRIARLSDNSDVDGQRDVIENNLYHVDNYVLDHDTILTQEEFTNKGYRQYWNVKILHIDFEDGTHLSLAVLRNNKGIYLINDKGETIERL